MGTQFVTFCSWSEANYSGPVLLPGKVQESKTLQVLLSIFLDDVCKVMFSGKGGQEETNKTAQRPVDREITGSYCARTIRGSQPRGFRLRGCGWNLEARDTEEGQGQGLLEVSSCHV